MSTEGVQPTTPARPADDGRPQLIRGSLALGLSVGLNALGGLLFWLMAAHLEDIDRIGRASALFQSLLFINYVTSLGLPVALARFGTRGAQSAAVARWAMRLRVAAAVASAALFLGIAHGTELAQPLWDKGDLIGAVTYTFLGVGMALAVLVEVRLVTLRAWGWVVLRAGVPALVRLPLLLVVTETVDHAHVPFWLFVLAAGPVALSGWVGAAALGATVDKVASWRARPEGVAGIGRFAAVNWLGLVATEGPIFAVPFVVALSVNSDENAAFYIAWSFGAIAFVLPQMVAQVVLSEASQHGAPLARLLDGLKLALGVTMAASVAAQLGAGILAGIYGDGYGLITEQLPLLVAASIGWSYTSIGLTSARIRQHNLEVVAISCTFLVGTMVPTLVFTPGSGSSAATWSWLFGNCCAAVLTGILYRRWRFRGGEMDLAGATLAIDASGTIVP